ncbi:spermine oxidase-like [Belonocnema kinseyi]|uniref:spermine oxidase-like n=1 Tax=Belonocnema kinseyi TaxID=2817044 RepID=UPI00143CE080|nr:spermine oxidase-like [Belonocnema kinseyi]
MILKKITCEKMLFSILMLYSMIFNSVNGDEESPSVLIVGAGAAGIAAASKLFENGFKNITILEAEDRIGGRVYTTHFGGYLVDLGGQWVHGEVGNVVFELAWPLGLLERGDIKLRNLELYDFSGNIVDQTVANDVNKFFLRTEKSVLDYSEKANGSTGEYFYNEYKKFLEAHPSWNKSSKGFLLLFDMIEMANEGADTWWDVSTKSEFRDSPGDYLINWKERGYGTILEILMKRYPNPEEELPVIENTVLNAEVSLINNKETNGKKVSVKTTKGDTYFADHVIVTCSLGVLKEQYSTLFQPPLSENKVKTIKSLGIGSVAKIYLSFEEPWWPSDTKSNGFTFLWNDEKIAQLENDSEKRWLLGLVGFYFVEHKPRLLSGWISGKYSREMEKLSEQQVFNHSVEVLQRFIGKSYNLTMPTGMLRTAWNSNKHFRGTYSFRSSKSDAENVWHSNLTEPIGGENPSLKNTLLQNVAKGWLFVVTKTTHMEK